MTAVALQTRRDKNILKWTNEEFRKSVDRLLKANVTSQIVLPSVTILIKFFLLNLNLTRYVALG